MCDNLIGDQRRLDGKHCGAGPSRDGYCARGRCEERLVRENENRLGVGMIPFIVTVQIVVVPAITGFGVQFNATTTGLMEVSCAVLFTPL